MTGRPPACRRVAASTTTPRGRQYATAAQVIGLPPVLVFGSPSLAKRVGDEVLSGRKKVARSPAAQRSAPAAAATYRPRVAAA